MMNIFQVIIFPLIGCVVIDLTGMVRYRGYMAAQARVLTPFKLSNDCL